MSDTTTTPPPDDKFVGVTMPNNNIIIMDDFIAGEKDGKESAPHTYNGKIRILFDTVDDLQATVIRLAALMIKIDRAIGDHINNKEIHYAQTTENTK